MINFPKKSNKNNLSICLSLTIPVAFLLATSCVSSHRPPVSPKLNSEQPRVIKQHTRYNVIEKRIRDEYKRWQGTRHRLGGTGSRGIDCSGFVQAVYKDVFNAVF